MPVVESKQPFKMLRLKGSESFLTTESGVPYVNVEWGPVQLENIARHHQIEVDQIEVVTIAAVPP